MKKKSIKKLLAFELIILIGILVGVGVREVTHGIDLNGDSETYVNLGEKFDDPGVKSFFAKRTGDVDTGKVGDYQIKYTLFGKTAVRNVHVVDPDELVIGLKGSEEQIVLLGEKYIEGGAFAIDKKTGPLKKVNIKGNVNTDKEGEYKVTYSAESRNIKKSITRKVKVLSKSDYGNPAKEIPVTMYHWIYNSEDKPSNIDGNWILDKDLEKHLQYLDEQNYYYPSWSELSAWIDGKISLPEKSIIMTFDDGKKAFFENGQPLFEKYKVPITSFMIGWEKNDGAYKVRKWASPYIDFESHSYAMHQQGNVSGHRGIMAQMSEKEIIEDLQKEQEVIQNNEAFAYPYGDYTDTAKKAIKKHGIDCAFTTEYGKVKRGMDKMQLPRVRVMGDIKFDYWKSIIN